MTKLLFATDIHLRATKPVARLDDDFTQTLINKIYELNDIAKDNEVAMVILGGDIFDRPDVPHSVVIKAIKAFERFTVPVCTVVGNHDIYGYHGGTVGSTALGVLFEAGSVRKLDSISGELPGISIYGIHAHDPDMWQVPDDDNVKILVAHKMLTNHPIPNAGCILLRDVAKETNVDVLLSGDIHYPHTEVIGKTLFVNPGSLGRLSIADRDRYPQAAIITVDGKDTSVEVVPLSSRPAETLFDIKNYSNRMASALHTKDFVKTFVHAVVSVKAESHRIGPALSEFVEQHGVRDEVKKGVDEYYRKAEQELLQEVKD